LKGGLLFGLQDGFIRAAMLVLVSGSLTSLESWPPYGVVAVTGLALALQQPPRQLAGV
jgi:hypothetical protein